MSDVFDEVEEDLRKERFEKLWKKYGTWFVGVATVAVLGTAGWVWYQNHSVEQARALGSQYGQALDLALVQDNTDAGVMGLRAVAERGGGYAVLARLRTAALLRESGDVSGAVAEYERLAADGSVDRLYRDLAEVLAIMNSLETGDNAALRERLAPLAEEGAPWRFSALEMSAVLAHRAGFRNDAREKYRLISDDPAAPAPMRARAAEMLAAFGPEGPGGLATE